MIFESNSYKILAKFTGKLDNKINQRSNRDTKSSGEMVVTDTTQINFFLMILKCVLNRVLMDCKFDVVSDSSLVNPLKQAVKDLQDNSYKIGGYMLGGSRTPDCKSECWAILIDKKCGIHHYMCRLFIITHTFLKEW